MKMYKRAIEIYRSEGIACLLRSALKFIWNNTTEVLRNSYRTKKYQLQYGKAAPNPDEVIYVNPKSIEYMIVPALRYKYPRTGTYVLGGDWDKRPVCDDYFSTKEFKQENNEPALLPFSEYGLYKSIKRRYLEGVSWEETQWYRYYISNLEDTQYNSVKEVDKKFKEIDRLYDKIKSNGYKTQRELSESNKNIFSPNKCTDEILVDIDRTGQLLFEDGRHRLSIAKVLGIKEVPVRVLVRHTEWQEIRSHVVSQDYEFQDQNLSNVSPNHPDLQQL